MQPHDDELRAVAASHNDIEAGPRGEHAPTHVRGRKVAGCAAAILALGAVACATVWLAAGDANVRVEGVSSDGAGGDALHRLDTGGIAPTTAALPAGFARLSTGSDFVGVLFSRVAGRVLFELPPSAFGLPFVVDALASKADGQRALYHEPIADSDDTVFLFRMAPSGAAVDLVRPNLELRAAPGSAWSALLEEAAWTGWEASFPLVGSAAAGGGGGEATHFIDVTDWLVGGAGALLHASSATQARLVGVRSFPRNLVASVEYRFPPEAAGRGRSMQLGVSYALALLPPAGFEARPRALDARVGYFATRYTLVGSAASAGAVEAQSGDQLVRLIHRWRLEPSGQARVAGDGPPLLLPERPITFHIDPSVPKRWRPAVARGVLSWLPAFEAAGWSGAVRVLQPGDADWPHDYDAADVRYATVSWAISTSGTYAIAPSTVDPRTGEILNADIMFTHSWVSAWLEDAPAFGAADGEPPAAAAAAARGDDTAVGRRALQARGPCGYSHAHERSIGAASLVRAALQRDAINASNSSDGSRTIPAHFVAQAITEVTMHEVGHTLGLRHNFKGSSAIPWSQVGNRSYTSLHGLTASVMDYMPTLILSDAERQGDFFTSTIGAYDRFAIEYGYAPLGGGVDEAEALARIAARADAHPELAFGTDEDGPDEDGNDPTASAWDVSSEPLSYAADALQLSKQLLESVAPSTTDPGALAAAASGSPFELAALVVGAMRRALSAARIAGKHVGGIVRGRAGEAGRGAGPKAVMAPVPARVVRRALDLLARMLTSNELVPSARAWARLAQAEGWCDGLQDYCLGAAPVDVLHFSSALRAASLSQVLQPARLRSAQLAAWALGERGEPALPAAGVLRALSDAIFAPAQVLDGSEAGFGRQLQRDYVVMLRGLAAGRGAGGEQSSGVGEAAALASGELSHVARVLVSIAASVDEPPAVLRAHWTALAGLL